MNRKKLAALVMAAALLATGGLGGNRASAASWSGSVCQGWGQVTCTALAAEATFEAYNKGYTSFCRVTPYDSSGSVIYGVQDQKLGGKAIATYAGTRALSKAIGTFRTVNVEGPVTRTVLAS